jgi:hypothetical protein
MIFAYVGRSANCQISLFGDVLSVHYWCAQAMMQGGLFTSNYFLVFGFEFALIVAPSC